MAVLAAALVVPLWVVATLPGPVFFSGDGGLKLLLVDQLARGGGLPCLDHPPLPAPAQARIAELWQQGFYPFAPPFVYPRDGCYLLAFPALFPLLSVPGYRLLGMPGLYLLPLAAVALLGWRVARRLERLEVPPGQAAVALGLLLVASPLALYGAMFWEHAPAVLLLFLALELVLDGPPASAWTGLGRGLLAGLAVWLRPEAFLFLGLLALLWWPGRRQLRPWLSVTAGAALAAGAFVAVNLDLYGHPLGAHSLQVLGERAPSRGLAERWDVLRELLAGLGWYVPAAPLCRAAAVLPALRQGAADQGRQRRLLALAVLFCLLVPFLVPNAGGKQWGPRYLLPVLPPLALLAALQLRHLRAAGGGRARAVVTAAVAGVLLLGLVRNTLDGGRHLAGDYRHRIYPAWVELQRRDEPVVVVSSQWPPQELAVEVRRRWFLRTPSQAELARLLPALERQGLRQVLYVTTAGTRVPPLRMALPRDDGSTLEVRTEHLGQYGDYAFLRLSWLAPATP